MDFRYYKPIYAYIIVISRRIVFHDCHVAGPESLSYYLSEILAYGKNCADAAVYFAFVYRQGGKYVGQQSSESENFIGILTEEYKVSVSELTESSF